MTTLPCGSFLISDKGSSVVVFKDPQKIHLLPQKSGMCHISFKGLCSPIQKQMIKVMQDNRLKC